MWKRKKKPVSKESEENEESNNVSDNEENEPVKPRQTVMFKIENNDPITPAKNNHDTELFEIFGSVLTIGVFIAKYLF